MSAETQAYQPIPEPVLQPNQFEVSTPRDEKGERIGIGAIIETRRPQLEPSEKSIFQTAVALVIRYGRTIQEPPDAKERQALRTIRSQLTAQQETSQVQQWAENHEDGHRYSNDEERKALEAKKQQTAAHQQKVA